MDEVEKFRFSRQQLKKDLESIVRDIDKFWEENDLENYKVEVSIAEGIISDLEAISSSSSSFSFYVLRFPYGVGRLVSLSHTLRS